MSETSGNGRRAVSLRRKSRETEVLLALDLDPAEPFAAIDSGIGFLDHMLTALATHAGFSLSLSCRGDLVVDDHHSAEDCALALGEALSRALALGPAPRRFGSAYAPLDEALARAVVDLSGRAFCRTDLKIEGARLGELAGENASHFLWSLASAARMTLHVDVLAGENAHHKAEAAFKALALALKTAVESTKGSIPSTKGSIPSTKGSIPSTKGSVPSTKGSVLLEELTEAEWKRAKEALDA